MDKRLLRSIAAISLPAVVTNITTPLLALTDTAIVGHMGSAVFLAAIAVGGTMFNMLYWLFGFLRMGSSGLTAQAFGASDRRGQQLVLSRALLVGLSVGLLLIVLQRPLSAGLLELIDSDAESRRLAGEYFRICIWGAPATLSMFALTGWCIGMQNTRIPMLASLFIDVFNIALSLALVFVFRLKIEGVALGTLGAQWAGFLLCLWLCVKRYGWITVAPRELTHGFGRFFRINSDIFLRTLCLVAVTMWFTRTGASQGDVTLAVNALLMQLFTLFSFFMDGLAFAGEALCGRYIGAADHGMLRRSIRTLMALASMLALAFVAVYFVGGEVIIGMLCDDAEVLSSAHEYMAWAVCIPLVGFSAFMWDGVFIGITRTRAMLLSMAVATVVYFSVYALLFKVLGNHGLWLAFLLYLLTRGVVLTLIAARIRNE